MTHFATATYKIADTVLTMKVQGSWISSQLSGLGPGSISVYTHEDGDLVRIVQFADVSLIDIAITDD